MVVHGSGVHGNEATGTEESEIQTVNALAGVARQAGQLGVAAIRAGGAALKNHLEQRQQKDSAPELAGDLYKAYREAFIENGVPQEIAEAAAAGLVQNEDAQSNPAIAEANRIVEHGLQPQSAEPEQAAPEQSEPEDALTTIEVEPEEEVEDDTNPKEAKAVAVPAQPQSLRNKTSTTIASPQPAKKQVEISEDPSKMAWPKLRKTAKAISVETREKPASGKRQDVLPFVTRYWDEQKNEQAGVETSQTSRPVQQETAVGLNTRKSSPIRREPKTQQSPDGKAGEAATQQENTSAQPEEEKKAVVAKPVTRTPIETPEPELAKDYSTGLKAAGADSEAATAAGAAIVEGKGADNSAEVAKANAQVKQASTRSKLQQMYYDVLAKQKGLNPDLIEAASKDLAEGKGAHSSN
ncbi:MAG: hypothetical protein ABG776_07535, partial [Cyanobacteria bacterium J06555_13]